MINHWFLYKQEQDIYNLSIDSIIESKKKMSYSEVNKVLDEGIVDDEYLPFLNDLTTFKELSDILTLKRKSEGMLTFIEHENNFIEDKDGNIISIEEKNNGTAGKMIENKTTQNVWGQTRIDYTYLTLREMMLKADYAIVLKQDNSYYLTRTEYFNNYRILYETDLGCVAINTNPDKSR